MRANRIAVQSNVWVSGLGSRPTQPHRPPTTTPSSQTISACLRPSYRLVGDPVAGAVVLLVVATAGILHDDGIPRAEVVEEPLRVAGADGDAAVADVALALVIHRPRGAVHEVADVVEPDGQLDGHLVAVGRIDRNPVGRGVHHH